MRQEPVHLGILAADIEGFGRLERTDPIRVRLRAQLHGALDAALVTAGIEAARIERSDQGDCVLALVDPQVSLARILHPLVPNLTANLDSINREAAPRRRLRLRVVIHAGELLADRFGHTGEALNHAFRLLDAEVVRAVLRGVPAADVVLVASEAVYQGVIKHDYPGIDPGSYQPVWVTSKETTARAWLHLPQCAPQPPLPEPLQAPTTPTRAAHAAPVPHELPADTGAFVGRATELQLLCRALEAAGYTNPGPIVISAINGTGGIGKSALAIHAAHRMADRFPDGQLYVDLHGATPGLEPLEPSEVLRRFLRTLGLDDTQIPTEVDEAGARFRSLLAGRRLLLVLDNAASAEQVRPLLPASPACAVLVTSRHALATLDDASPLRLDVLTPEQAIELLGRLAGQARIAAEPEAAARVAQLCGHLPLALRIAGSRLAARTGWTVAALADRLNNQQRRLDELELGDRAVRASFQLSYQPLATSADLDGVLTARMFRMLGLLDGPDISTPVAAALLDRPPSVAGRVLERLVDAHLLETPTQGRYRMHDLLRLFAREHAFSQESPIERRLAMERVLSCYFATARHAARLIRPTDSRRYAGDDLAPTDSAGLQSRADAVAWLQAERGNLLAVAYRVTASGDGPGVALLIRLAAALFWPLAIGGHLREMQALNQVTIQAAQRVGNRVAEADALHDLGYAFVALFQFEDAHACLGQAVAIFRDLGDQRGEARTLFRLASMCCRWKRFDQALTYAEQALRMHCEVGDRYGEAGARIYLGRAYESVGRLDEAQLHLEQALAIQRDLGDGLTGDTLHSLGRVCMRRGQLDEARNYLERSLAAHRDFGGRWCQTDALIDLAEVYRLIGDPETTLACCQQRLELHREFGNRRGEGDALQDLGKALDQLGDRHRARRCWHDALAVFEELGMQTEEAETRALLQTSQGVA
jgi:tetratricopeptide (TPR) repeat protein